MMTTLRQSGMSPIAAAGRLALAVCAASGPVLGQDVEEAPAEASAMAREVAEGIEVTREESGSPVRCDLVPRALLLFGDPARANTEGSVWAWGRTGRPDAVMELYFNDEGSRIQVITSLSEASLTAQGDDGFRWTPDAALVEPWTPPSADTPADREAARLRQMRQIARGLAAHEFWDPDNQRYELRLLPQPVHRYADPDTGLIDGAIFAFAHGTNPEVLLLIEARAGDGPPRWECVFARLGHAEMHVQSDGQEVWTAQRVAQPTATEPYWLFYKSGAGR